MINATKDGFAFGSRDIWSCFHACTFDFSVWEIWGALTTGGQALLVAQDTARNPAAFAELLSDQGVTILNQTPSAFYRLSNVVLGSDIELPDLRLVVFGGEALEASRLSAWLDRFGENSPALVNMYGITETTVHVTARQPLARSAANETGDIGSPIPGLRAYVLDLRMELVPFGVTGEVYVGGSGLSRGYIGQPGLTAAQFVADPFAETPGARLYRTGDLARWRPDGTLDFLGRADTQIKIRGMRVEPGEIEAALAAFPGVGNASVVARHIDAANTDQELLAYLVPIHIPAETKTPPPDVPMDVNTHFDLSSMRSELRQTLPDHMIPTRYVCVPQIPLTSSGKVDLEALPQEGGSLIQERYRAPLTLEETQICRVVAEVINAERVGLSDRFFEIGGDSIKALRVVGRLNKSGLPLTVKDLYQAPDLGALSDLLTVSEKRHDADILSRFQEPFCLISSEERAALPKDLVDAYPLGRLQAGMLFHSQKRAQSGIYHDVLSYRIKLPFDAELLESVLADLVSEHAILRTSIHASGQAEWLQLVHKTGKIQLKVFDLSDLTDVQIAESMRRFVLLEKDSTFDWTQAPLARMFCHLEGTGQFSLTLSFHHAILDGWSVASLFTALLEAYRDKLSGDSKLTERKGDDLSFSYRDFVALEADARQQSDDLNWWQDRLVGAETARLPKQVYSTRPGVSQALKDSGTVDVQIDQTVLGGLRAFAVDAEVPLKSVFLAAHLQLIGTFASQTDVLSGLISNGRPEVDGGDRILGLFLNTLPFRLELDHSEDWHSLVRRVFAVERELISRRRVPLFDIQQHLEKQDLVETAFNFVDFHIYETLAQPDLPGLVSPGHLSFERTNFSFTTNVVRFPDTSEFGFSLSFDPDQVAEQLVRSMADHLDITIRQIARDGKSAVGRVGGLSPEDVTRIVSGFNDVGPTQPANRTLLDLFSEQVLARPQAAAVRFDSKILSYGALDRRSNQLARHLIGRGVGPETVVGVCLDASTDLIVTLLAILKTGGSYLPLDPGHPAERRAGLLRDINAKLLVTTKTLNASPETTETLCLDTSAIQDALAVETADAISDGDRLAPLTPASLAYVIYTSGSTGVPKAIAVDHAALGAYLAWSADRYQPEPGEVVPICTALSFDATVTSLWLPLVTGACVQPLARIADPSCLGNVLHENERISFLKTTPSQLRLLSSSAADIGSRLRRIVLGGETLWEADLAAWSAAAPDLQIVNEYGPSEATIGCTIYETCAAEVEPGALPIGGPAPGSRTYVVDAALNPVAIGVWGELLIGGDQVTRGYVGRPGLTAESFIADPFSDTPGARLYRSGDLARWRPDGVLEFRGRIDAQLKIRGVRVEPREVEAALSALEVVGAAAVTGRRPEPGRETELIAYLVPDADPPNAPDGPGEAPRVSSAAQIFDLDAIRAALRRRLPEAMVPTAFVALSHLPLSPAGKLDRRALPDVQAEVIRRGHVPPRDDLEIQVCALMRDVIRHDRLNLDRVGLEDNFFDIGGHSIFAAQFCSRLGAALGREVPLRWLFEEPTVRALVARLRGNAHQTRSLPPVQPADRTRPIPASFEQERMWLLNEIHKDNPVYNEGIGLWLTDEYIALDDVTAAIRDVLGRFEVLRTRVEGSIGDMRQIIMPPEAVTIVSEDWVDRNLNPEKAEASIAERAREMVSDPYDLERDCPCRIMLIRISRTRLALVFAVHHIAADNWSIAHVLLRDFLELYRGHRENRPPQLPELKAHYADYATWQKQPEILEERRRLLGYWQKRLADLPASVELPEDRPAPKERTHHGARLDAAKLGAEDWRKLEEFVAKRGVSPYTLFAAALATVLARTTRSEDVVIGVPHTGRPHPDLWNEFGYFGNTLLLDLRVDGGQTFSELLDQAFERLVSALQNADADPTEILNSLDRTPDALRLLLVMHAYFDDSALRSGTLQFELLDVMPSTAKYDLVLDVRPGRDGAVISIEYATDIFDEGTVRHLGEILRRVVLAGIEEPETLQADLPLMERAERETLLVDFNATGQRSAADETILTLIAEHTRLAPTRIAVAYEDQTLTYAELEIATNKLARHFLSSIGACPEPIVAVCLGRSADLVTVLLAIWKTGGAYLPLDPDDPPARLAAIIENAGAPLVVTTSDIAEILSERVDQDIVRVMALDTDPARSAIAACAEKPLSRSERPHPPDAGSLAYIVYTSGSTGTPKGVAAHHGGLAQLVQADFAKLDKTTRVLNAAHVAFDATMFEIWAPLASGETVVVSRNKLLHADDFREFVDTNDVSVAWLTAGLFHAFVRTDPTCLAGLRTLIVGGDAIDPEAVATVRDIFPQLGLLNGYGPTETVTFSAIADLTRYHQVPGVFVLGKPLPGTTLYVVDDRLNPVPVGSVGELLIGGDQVTRGYVGRPGLTAESFIADPFLDTPGARLYRSGDLARWRPDGVLEFRGRIDAQLKIRGVRVEPREVEAALSALEVVGAAAVTGRRPEPGRETELIAYLVPDADPPNAPDGPGEAPRVSSAAQIFDLDAIRAALRRRLPEAMVPTAFVALSHLPLSPAGKLDRRALPDVQAEVVRRGHVPPRDDLEIQVCALMRDVIRHDRLDLDQVGLEDNFFDIGGHSIFAAQFCSRLGAALGREVPLRWLFEEPTVRALVARLRGSAHQTRSLPPVQPADRTRPIPASFEQERMWLLNEIHKDNPVYNEGIGAMFTGLFDTDAFLSALSDVLNRYEVLRTRIVDASGQLRQVIDPPGSIEISFLDWSDRVEPQVELEREAAELCSDLQAEPYNLSDELPCRSLVIRLAPDRHVWCLAVHHIAADNWSMSHILPEELFQAYDAKRQGTDPDLPDLPLSFADYAVWQRSDEMTKIIADQLAYWQQKLQDSTAPLPLPASRQRPKIRSHDGARLTVAQLPWELWRDVESTSALHGASPFIFFSAIMWALLGRLSGSNDISIGTPHTTKPESELWPVFGYFGNTLVLRGHVGGQKSFADLLDQARKTVLDAFAHQDVPFESVVEAVGDRPLNTTPLFQVLVVMHAFLDQSAHRREDFKISLMPGKRQVAKYDLVFDINPTDAGLRLDIVYATDMFDEAAVKRFGTAFQALTTAAVRSLQEAIGNIPILDAAQQQRLLAPAKTRPSKQTVLEQFQAQVASDPGRSALYDGHMRLSYSELDNLSSHLALQLLRRGLRYEEMVSVCLDRSAELIVAMLAIWKAGAAYVPLKPSDPATRHAEIIQDAGISLVITDKAKACRFDTDVLRIDTQHKTVAANQIDRAPLKRQPPGPDSLAYVIYTSGSTGRPKGVAQSHKTLTNLVDWSAEWVPERTSGLSVFHRSISFDGSIRDIVCALCLGGTLRICGADISEMDFKDICAFDGPVGLYLTPTMFRYLDQNTLDALKSITSLSLTFAGEALIIDDDLSEKLARIAPIKIYNDYGPTETHAVVSGRVKSAVRLPAGKQAPIGTPALNTQAYVVDENLELQPIGIPGELLIGGVQVARGYTGKPAQTAAAFIADPFSGIEGSRVYRTGDRAVWSEDGLLQILGRIDDQMQLRGIRVEPSEIEFALCELPEISDAVVIGRDIHGQPSAANCAVIEAYLVPPEAQNPNFASETFRAEVVFDLSRIRERLASKLPDHMIPGRFIGLARIPMNASGKTDRTNLPEAPEDLSRSEVMAPRTEFERVVAREFEALLGHAPVGREDDFFALGGHSLLAVRLCLALRRETGCELPARAVFYLRTVFSIARSLEEDSTQDLPTETVGLNKQTLLSAKPITYPYPARCLANSSGVVLTGATGFVGSHVLRRLISHDVPIMCMVRADTQEQADARIQAIFSVDGHATPDTVHALAVDFGKAAFGLPERLWDSLLRKPDTILHCAAQVNFMQRAEDLVAPNVELVEKLLELGSSGMPKTFHHVSTLGVFGPATRGDISETTQVNATDPDRTGYATTKAWAETRVAQMQALGMRTTILRPSLVLGNTKDRLANFNDAANAFLGLCTAVGSAPDESGEGRWMVPIAELSDAIVSILNEPDLLGETYHLSSWQGVSAQQICQAAKRSGINMLVEDGALWAEKCRELIDKHPELPFAWFVNALPAAEQMKTQSVAGRRLCKPQLPKGIVAGLNRGIEPALARALKSVDETLRHVTPTEYRNGR
ncbi:amino acid adenylation domain-containing protein [Ruegeria discodermiae]|uniref:amino acid adenylation domain-containing protein n=1 Tax=Ruegeria discodermiae TaxID=3064389 RepID=UPI003531F8FA